MKKHSDEPDDQQWFDSQLEETLTRFDSAHIPHVPELQRFEDMVREHKQHLKRKLWKDLMLLWLTACLIFGLMMWMLDRNWLWFAILQAVIAAAGISFVSIMFSRRKVRSWRS